MIAKGNGPAVATQPLEKRWVKLESIYNGLPRRLQRHEVGLLDGVGAGVMCHYNADPRRELSEFNCACGCGMAILVPNTALTRKEPGTEAVLAAHKFLERKGKAREAEERRKAEIHAKELRQPKPRYKNGGALKGLPTRAGAR